MEENWLTSAVQAYKGGQPVLPLESYRDLYRCLDAQTRRKPVEVVIFWGEGGIDRVKISLKQLIEVLDGGYLYRRTKTSFEGDRFTLYWKFSLGDLHVETHDGAECWIGKVRYAHFIGPEYDGVDLAKLVVASLPGEEHQTESTPAQTVSEQPPVAQKETSRCDCPKETTKPISQADKPDPNALKTGYTYTVDEDGTDVFPTVYDFVNRVKELDIGDELNHCYYRCLIKKFNPQKGEAGFLLLRMRSEKVIDGKKMVISSSTKPGYHSGYVYRYCLK